MMNDTFHKAKINLNFLIWGGKPVVSSVGSSVHLQMLILKPHTPYSKMPANKLFFCLHVN